MPSRRSALAALAASAGAGRAAPARAARAPSTRFDLTDWKLQLPGPAEVEDLEGYKSRFFRLDRRGRMRFWIDAALEGSTPKSSYVRSELRHLADWPLRGGPRSLAARLSIAADLSPAQVTFLQVHGTTAGGGDAPPLLRVALLDRAPVAWIKQDARGERTERVPLGPPPGEGAFDCLVEVVDGVLSVSYDGGGPVVRDLGFWPFDNYFKAGLYPQAREGRAIAWFERLSVVV